MSPEDIAIFYDADYATQKGGAQKRLFQLGKLATKPPGRIYWVAFKFWKGPSCFFVQEGIHYLGILPKPKFYSEGGERTKLEPILYLVNVILMLPFWIRKPRFVVGQWPLVHIPLVLTLSRLLRKRVVVEWWETWGRYWQEERKSRLGFLLEKFCIWCFSALKVDVVTDCVEEVEKLKTVNNKVQVSICENGVSLSDFPDPNRPQKSPVVVSLGRLKSHKRIDLIIRAICILNKDRIGDAIELKIIGDGPERSNLIELSRTLNGNTFIHFLGLVEPYSRVVEELSSSWCGILATIAGGAGNVTAREYMAAGLPVVAVINKDIGLSKTLVEEGKTGLMVEEPDVTLVAESLKSLIFDEPLMKEMRQTLIDRRQSLDWKVTLSEHPILTAVAA